MSKTKTLSPEHRHKISKAKLGEKNPQWKGDNVGYLSLHAWVRSRLPMPDKCQKCFEGPAYDLANITGKYTRDLTNWKYLCRKCHMWFDGRLLARDKNGRWISPKRIKVYSPISTRSQGVKVYPNIFASSTEIEHVRE